MAYYYIDYVNGNDAHTGLREPAGDYNSVTYYTTEAGTDSTHIHAPGQALIETADDAYNGDFLYNVTRGIGALITDFTHTGHIITVAIAGMDVGDTFYILKSYKTISTYYAGTRTVGDIGYVRNYDPVAAGVMTHTVGAAHLVNATVATPASRISLIGCNATQSIDPWHNSSDLRAIIDIGNQNYYMESLRAYWYYKNLKIYNSANSNGTFYVYNVNGILIENCVFDSNSHASGYTFHAYGCANITIRGCAMSNGKFYSAYLESCADIKFEDYGTTHCTIDGGANTTPYGILISSGADLILENVVFGGVAAIATQEIRAIAAARPILRNCTFTVAKRVAGYAGAAIYEEDTPGTGKGYGSQIATYYNGSVTKCAAGLANETVHSGGATSSALLIPTTYAGVNNPVSITEGFFSPDFIVWCPASTTTVTVWIRAYGTWSPYPTASELWIQALYVSDDATPTRTLSTASTQVLSDTTTWVAFTTTFTPHIESWVEIKVKLTKYQDASTGCYVDVKPVVS